MSSPREPRADIRIGAAVLHETFVALLGAGFTEYQALAIVGQMVIGQQQPPDPRGNL